MNAFVGIDAGALPIAHAIMPKRDHGEETSPGIATAPSIAKPFQGLVKP